MSGPALACLGDSLTQGWGLAPDQALPVQLQDLLRQAGQACTVRNFGISGETAADGLRRVEAVRRAGPDAVIVEFGANDAFLDRAPAQVEADLDAICARLAPRPLLLTGFDAGAVGESADPAYVRAFNPVFARVAARHGALFFPDVTAPFLNDPGKLLADGFHPDAAGVLALARALLPLALELCARTRRSRNAGGQDD
ncbi:MAG: GDSL-type esterase/lipase family protein [Desulfovibrionaceae bacterium]